MGKASNAKKVNRAAATGGGRTSGTKTPVLWYTALFLVVVLGVSGVFVSSKGIHDKQAAADATAPRPNRDHWHAAYGFFICDHWAPNLVDQHRDRFGIHSHGDGLMHTHPTVASASGKNATFGKFLAEEDATVSSTKISLPGEGGTKSNGNKCGKKVGFVTATVFSGPGDTKGTVLTTDPATWKIRNAQIIAVGFVPRGTKLTVPPSAANLRDPKDTAASTRTTEPVSPDVSVPDTPTTLESPSPTTRSK